MCIKEDGSLWGAGLNENGQLGIGNPKFKKNEATKDFVQIIPSGVKAVAAGAHHTLIIKENGSLWAIGANWSGQLGDGTLEDKYKPIRIIESGVQSVSTSCSYSLIHMEDGSLWGMGDNNMGQLGVESPLRILKPRMILSSGVKDMSAGCDKTLFIREDGTLWHIGGEERFYAVADPFSPHPSSPIRTVNYRPLQYYIPKVTKADTFTDHFTAILENGSLFTEGFQHNSIPDLTEFRNWRLHRALQSGIVSVSTIWANHSLVLKSDGRLWNLVHGPGSELEIKPALGVINYGMKFSSGNGRDYIWSLEEHIPMIVQSSQERAKLPTNTVALQDVFGPPPPFEPSDRVLQPSPSERKQAAEDSQSIQYTLVPGKNDEDNAVFRIEKKTLVLNQDANQQKKNLLKFRVLARHSSGFRIEKAFALRVRPRM